MHRVRVHGQAREPDVVGVGDRAPEPAPEHVADVEVLVEAASPDLGRGLRRAHQRPFVRSSGPAEIRPLHILRRLQQPTCALDHREVDHLTVHRDRAAPLGEALLVGVEDGPRPLELGRDPARRRGSRSAPAPGGCRPFPASRANGRVAPRPRASSSLRTRRCTTSSGPADAGRRRVDDELRARVEDLEAVAARLQPELGGQVDGAEHERRDPGQARGLVGEAQALRRLDDRDHRRAGVAERLDGLGRRLGQHDPGERRARGSPPVVVEELGIGAVDTDRLERSCSPPRRARERRARGQTPSRPAPPRPRGPRSMASAPDSSARRSRRSSEPGVKRSERTLWSDAATSLRLYVRHSTHVNRRLPSPAPSARHRRAG